MPECSLDEAEFLTRLTELTDCTLLLDVTNIYNNAVNHGYDPVGFVRRLPGQRVRQLHLAGGHRAEGMWQDSHSYPVMAPVWDLLHEVLRLTSADVVILERDSNFYPFEQVLHDLRKARAIFYQYRPGRAPAPAGPGDPVPAAAPDADVERLLADPEVEQLAGSRQPRWA